MQNGFEGPLVRLSLWLHLAFIGASAVAAGFALMFDGETSWLSALAVTLAGAVLAVVGWHRGRILLGPAEPASFVAKDQPQHSAGSGGAPLHVRNRAERERWIVNG